VTYGWPDCYPDEAEHSGDQPGQDPYDVVIVGAGVVGCALAYKLSQFKLRVLLLDKNYDVGEATSKGNSAIVHTGFDAPPGTLEARLVTQASRIWPDLAQKLKIPYEECGALVLAIDDEQHRQLTEIHEKAVDNGVDDVELLSAEEVLQLETNVPGDVLGALLILREAIADPFATSIAFAEVALANGVDISLGTELVEIEDPSEDLKTLVTSRRDRITARIIVNVAGLGSRHVADLYGGGKFHINPRRGQFLVFDKSSRSCIQRILLPIPTPKSKGVLVIPTIFGNLLAGPTAEDFELGDEGVADTSTDKLQDLLTGAARLFPGLVDQPVIGTFAGVRCNCAEGSYLIRSNDGHKGMLTVTGVRSTGFTSSPALADHLIGELRDNCELELERNPSAVDSRSEKAWPGWWKRPFAEKAMMETNSDYGKIICYCEQISRGEIVRNLDSALKPRTLDGIKRRTRAQMGRCQGFDCQVGVAEVISDHCGIAMDKITKRGPDSEMVRDVNNRVVVKA